MRILFITLIIAVIFTSNSCPGFDSGTGKILSRAAAEITEQPKDAIVCKGGTVTFSVKARPTIGDRKLKYSWIDLEGNILQDGPGRTGAIFEGTQTATLIIRNIQPDDGGIGTYAVVVDFDPSDFSSASPTTSRNINVWIIERLNMAVTLRDTSVCTGTPVKLTAKGDVMTSKYRWYKDGSLVQDGANDSYITPPQDYEGRYTVVCENSCGDSAVSEAIVTEERPPVITSIEPSDLIYVYPGTWVTFKVTVEGKALHYQWYKDGNPIPGATNDTLQLMVSNFQAIIGQYYVTVSNDCGTTVEPVKAQFISSVDDIVDNGYKLSLSTPNPVINNSTISFNIPAPQHARLVVTDVTGNQVAVLFDAVAAGTTSVRFDSASLAPGVYFYTLTAGGFRATQSMSVVK